jgi:K+-sensing histidine kinase KdpD
MISWYHVILRLYLKTKAKVNDRASSSDHSLIKSGITQSPDRTPRKFLHCLYKAYVEHIRTMVDQEDVGHVDHWFDHCRTPKVACQMIDMLLLFWISLLFVALVVAIARDDALVAIACVVVFVVALFALAVVVSALAVVVSALSVALAVFALAATFFLIALARRAWVVGILTPGGEKVDHITPREPAAKSFAAGSRGVLNLSRD